MRSIRRIWLALTVCLMASIAPMRAQIPADVKPILEKAEEWFDDSEGIDISMTGKVLAVKTEMRSLSKGDKALITMSMKVMGKTFDMEVGYDGKQSWTYSPQEGTLTITASPDKPKDDRSVDMKLVSEYKRAKMKQTDKAYEITLSEPKSKDAPAKMVLTVRRSDCMPTQMELGSGLKKMSLAIKGIKKGVDDSVFVLDTKNYPNAKIVRK